LDYRRTDFPPRKGECLNKGGHGFRASVQKKPEDVVVFSPSFLPGIQLFKNQFGFPEKPAAPSSLLK
jgi:hypothetical protein